MLMMSISYAHAQFITIGAAGTTNTNGSGSDPVDGYYNSMRYQVVYTAAELTAAGLPSGATLTGLGWAVTEDYGGGNLSNYTIRLAHTTATNSAAHDASTLTEVKAAFSYNPTVTGNGAFDVINFDSNFSWDGTSNILVDVCTGTANPFTSPYGGVQTYSSAASSSRRVRCDACGSQCAVNTGTANATKPSIRFNYTSSACSGAPAPGNTLSNNNPACTGSNFTLSLQNPTLGSGVTYQWQSSPDGISWGNISGAQSATLITSQTANTHYQCLVTCGSNTTASNPLLVTIYSANTLTYFEGFNTTGTAVFPTCWTQQFVTGTSSISFQTSTSNPTTAPFEGTRHVYWNSFSYSAGQQTRLVSSRLNSTGINSVDVNFQWYTSSNYSTNNDGVQVQYSLDGTNWTNAGSFIPRYTATNAWTAQTITLPSSVGNQPVFFVGFLFTSQYGDNCSMDALYVRATPTCFPVAAPVISAITTTGATATWTPPTQGNTPHSYVYKVVLAGSGSGGAAQATGQIFHPTTQAVITGLNPATTYDVYIRTYCDASGTDKSDWSALSRFTTLCNPVSVSTAPICEYFDGVTTPAIPVCWARENVNNDAQQWQTAVASTLNGTPVAPSLPNVIFVSANATTDINDWLFTPRYNLTAGKLYQISFKVSGGNTTYPGKIKLVWGSGGNQSVAGMNGSTLWQRENLQTVATFQPTSVYFTPTTTDVYCFGFHVYSGINSYGILLDDYCIQEVISTDCNIPGNISVYSITGSSVTANWNSPNLNPNGDNSFDIEIGTLGFVPWTGNAVQGQYGITSNTVTFTGLNPVTQYQIYVREYCDPNNNPATSPNAGPATFSTYRANDQCATAELVTTGVTTSVTSGYEGNGSIPLCTSGSSGNYTDVWYKFVAPSSGSKLQIVTTAGSSTDWIMEVYSYCGGTAIFCSDDANGTLMPQIDICQYEYTAGETYYIRLMPYTASNTATCTFAVNEVAPCPVPPANNDCTSAITLTNCTAPISGSTSFSTPAAGIPISTCDLFGTYNDVWYKFNVGNQFGSLSLNITEISGTIEYAIYKGSCTGFLFTGICNSNVATAPGTTLPLYGIEPNQDYYVRVWSNPGAEGDFTICLDDNSASMVVSPGTANSCLTATAVNINATNMNTDDYVPIVDASGNIIAAINSNFQDLGAITCKVYVNTGAVRVVDETEYVDRNIEITPQNQPTSAVFVRLYLTDTELNNYIAANDGDSNDAASISAIKATKVPSLACSGTYTPSPFSQLLTPMSNSTYSNGHFIEVEVESFSSFFLHGGSEILPVELTKFTGYNRKDVNVLDWVTNNETNNKHFILERSNDGVNFNAIATIGSKAENGNSVDKLTYTYTDSKPYVGKNYYRLQQVDLDGHSFTSNVVMLQVKGKPVNIITAAPNPTSSIITANVRTEEDCLLSINVIDQLGKILMTVENNAVKGDNPIPLNISNLSTGAYILRITDEKGNSDIHRIVRQ